MSQLEERDGTERSEDRAEAPTPEAPTAQVRADAPTALGRAVAALSALQDPGGWWKGELETNVSMDAEDLLLREFLGIRHAEETAASARWIRDNQREDGTWANFYGGPPELSTTIEAYVALRLAGDPADAEHLERARRYIVDAGGVEQSRVFTRLWLALVGLWPWDELPVVPPEIMFLPSWFPLNIYHFACWARQSVVAFAVVNAHRPVRAVPFTIDELITGERPRASRSLRTWAGRFTLLDRVLHVYEKRPLGVLRRAALRRAEAWILQRQEADGSWGGIQPPWVYSLIALNLQGYALDHPVMRAGLDGLDAFTIIDDAGRRLEACQSPVWDTALAVIALADAGAAPDDERIASAQRFLVSQEVRVQGDWSVHRPDLAPGGWAFEFENDNYPDIDDTAEVVLALDRALPGDDGAVERAIAWIEGMQCRDGGWASFDVDNFDTLCRELPFCDFGELVDPPSADVTAHVIEMLAARGVASDAVGRGVAWLRAAQESDGSWFGRWGANYVYGTGAVLPALVAAGVAHDDPCLLRAVAWLADHQNDDGGWGEDLRSYVDATYRGRGPSTASQTAWALLGLLAVGADASLIERGVDYLVATQDDDGNWSEPFFTGTGFPGAFYINYHLYRLVFPIMALGRFVNGGSGWLNSTS